MATSVSSNTLEAKISARPGKIGLIIFAIVLPIGESTRSRTSADLEHALRVCYCLMLLGWRCSPP
jgi:hypothetical protein